MLLIITAGKKQILKMGMLHFLEKQYITIQNTMLQINVLINLDKLNVTDTSHPCLLINIMF